MVDAGARVVVAGVREKEGVLGTRHKKKTAAKEEQARTTNNKPSKKKGMQK